MPTPNKKRAGLNPKQIAVMNQIRNLSEAEVAKGARVCKKELDLKAVYPFLDTSLDADLFLPSDVEAKGWDHATVRRYTSYFLGLARKKDEGTKPFKERYTSVEHPYAPLFHGADGKPKPEFAPIKAHPPVRLVSERLLLFLILGLAIVKGSPDNKDKKYRARQALWDALGIRPATVVRIGEDDEVLFWNSVTVPLQVKVEDTPIQATLFPVEGGLDGAIAAFGGFESVSPEAVEEPTDPSALEGVDDLTKGLALLTRGVQTVIAQVKVLQAQNGIQKAIQEAHQEDRERVLHAKERALDKRKIALDAREKSMVEKEAVLAQVLRVTESLRRQVN
jgi:hypothetical protein